jgi:non-specific serine/threonine protein kinase/serine/threonine-protein kinase
VALKLLLPERVDSKGLDFFAREARAGGRLSHPGIVAIHGTGEDEGLHWIAMELVEDACDLRRALDGIREEDELPGDYYEQSALFLAETADALEVAHAAGVIHRDLKPANILVTPDDHPKVSDFGLAKLTDEHSISLAGDLVGTYFYMSPEQVAAKRMGLDHRTDVFSLGVVLYEMLTLVRPFEGDTTEQVAHKILVVDPPPPNELRSKVPRDLAVICGKAMEKDPERRYGSMAKLAADLRRHLADEPILARPPGTLERAVKWVRRNPTKSAVAGVAAAALVVISWLGLVATENADRAQKSAKLATSRAETLEERSQELAEANADLVDERDRADESARRAEEQRAEAETQKLLAQESAQREAQRAEELQQVSDFQAEQLSGVDAAAMGLTIRSMVLERARAAGERAGREPTVLEEEQAELEKLLAGADFTGMARDVLDKEVFEGALKELESFGNQPLVQAQLLQTVASTLRKLGLLERALRPQEQALEIRRRELGDEDPDTLSSVNHIGNLLQNQGKHGEAESYFREALTGRRSALGDEHLNTLISTTNLGVMLKTRGKFDEAEHLLREALAGFRSMFGDEHPDTMGAINNLASLLCVVGKLDAAEPLLKDALAGARTHFGNEHPSTMALINNLGSVVYSMGQLLYHQGKLNEALGKLDAAEPLYREALEGRRRKLGDEHPSTLTSINNLSALLHARGKLDDAEPLIREALEARRSTLGDDHPDTLNSIQSMGMLLKDRDKLEEAETLLRDALEGLRRTLGDEHPNTQHVKRNLESLLKKKEEAKSPPIDPPDEDNDGGDQ